MKRSKTDSFILKLPLRCEQWHQDYLNKVFRIAGYLHNNLMDDRLKALKQMESTKVWRNAQQIISDTYKAINESKDKVPTVEQEKTLKDAYAVKNDLLKKYGFSKYAFESCIQKWRRYYKSLVGTHVAQKIADSAWASFEDYFFASGKEIHFKPWTKFTSVEGKDNKTGIRFLETKDHQWVMRINKVDVPVEIPNTEYVRTALKSRVKYCRIVRIPWYGKNEWLYSLQLVLEGKAPEKDHLLGKGAVGIDIGTQTIAVVGDNQVTLEEIAPGANMPEKQLRRISRAMDRSKRATNPQMYDEKGRTIRIDRLPEECVRNGKRLWNYSKRYRKLAQAKRYLYVKQARVRKCQHRELANRLLSYGDRFFIEKMDFAALAKKAKRSTNDSGKEKRRKRFGKSVANKAPAMLVNRIEERVFASGGRFYRINTKKAKASQYDHTDKCYHKKKLSKRWNTLASGDKVQRDLYSAYLLQNTNSTFDGFIQQKVEEKYQNFKRMHDAKIQELQYIPTPSSTGVKYIA